MKQEESQLLEQDEPLSSRLSKNIKKHRKILLLISLIALLIILIHLPKASVEQVGGISLGALKMGSKMGRVPGIPGMPGGNDGGANEGGSGRNKTSFGSPLGSGINIMWWITKNILLFYAFLLFITVVPSLPILLYITIFYFIISGLIGKIKTF